MATDTVSLSNLTKIDSNGNAYVYRLVGKLVNYETGEAIKYSGSDVSVTSDEFTYKQKDGAADGGFSKKIEQEFYFDASGLQGITIVATETLQVKNSYGIWQTIAEESLDSLKTDAEELKNQSLYVPGIGTLALGSDTNDHMTNGTGTVKITDTVSYQNLPGHVKYTVMGTLMKKVIDAEGKITVEEVKDASGNAVTAQATFTAPDENVTRGTAEVTFEFEASDNLAGSDVVVYEKISHGDDVFAVHEDIEDEGQTVHLPKIKTTAVDEATNEHFGVAVSANSGNATIIKDAVEYSNLIPGRIYKLKGTLMVKSTGEPLKDSSGATITAEKEFAAAFESGTEELEFTIDSSLLSGETVVVYENLYYNEIEVAVHADIEDEDQSVHFPEIGTTLATDTKSETHAGEVSEKANITDVVSYKNLIVGKEYTVKGTLMKKDTGEAVVDGYGNAITAEKTFTAETSDGELELEFDVDSEGLEGTTIVVFEDLYYEDLLIASHTDIEDEDQSVHYPTMGTTATVDGKKKVKAEGTVTVKDIVSYENLIPGQEYIVKGVLMDKDTGKKLKVGGKEVTSEATFTPKKASGKAEVTFEFDASKCDGKTIVVFETLCVGEAEILYHNDIGDEAQTVLIGETPGTPKTGDITRNILLGAGLAALGAGLFILIRRRRRKLMK